jgi:signal transduction histidine kinase
LTQRGQVALTSRAFCLAAVFCLSVVTSDSRAIRACVVVLVAGALSVYVSRLLGTMSIVALTVETLVVASVMGYYARDAFILMPYLVVLTLLAGLFASLPAVLLTMAAQVIGLSVVLVATDTLDVVTAIDVAWLLTTCGGGLLGIWARSLGPPGITGETDAHYESARQLLTQLRAVARRLSAGLDSDGISAQLMETVSEPLDSRYAAVFVKTSSSVLIPLGFRGPGASQVLSPTDPIVARCWTDMAPVHGVVPSGDRQARHRTALPLRVGSRMIGVVFTSSSEPADESAVAPLMKEVDAHSLRLDTALVFDEIRTLATADERQRLAREIHDGIAQEVASLGYVVDDLAATSSDPAVAEGLHGLRRELSRVVADLRLSIFDLRSDVSPTNGLGAALSDYVRQVGAKSDLTVHLTLDEAPTRLTPAVEGELLRIAQEAVTNARKHSSADNLWVDFWTDPPRARLVVRDDGTGISGGRDDSYGISIMRERAQRIDATLDIVTDSSLDPAHGTAVQVTVAPDRLLLEEGITLP